MVVFSHCGGKGKFFLSNQQIFRSLSNPYFFSFCTISFVLLSSYIYETQRLHRVSVQPLPMLSGLFFLGQFVDMLHQT